MKLALIALSSALISFTAFAGNTDSVEKKVGQAVDKAESKGQTTTTDKTLTPVIDGFGSKK